MARRGRRGEGTVYWSKADRRWVAKWPLGVVNGKRQAKRAKFRTRPEAEDERDRMRRLYGSGGSSSGDTLDTYLARWLPDHARSIRPSTATSYAGHIRLHIGPLLGGIPIGKLRPADVRRLIGDLERKGRSAGTIHLVVRTLSVAMNAAVADRILTDNPCDGVRLPRITREPVRVIAAADAEAIIDATRETWIGPLVRLLIGSGMRLGEACGLRQGDLLLDDGYVRLRVSKTTIRAVPVSADGIAALREALIAAPRRGPHEPVFYGPRTGDQLRGSSVSHALPRILEAAGLGHLAPHGLRHGHATLLVEKGVHMRVIAEQLGHRNPALTARVYAHVVPESQRSAVGLLDTIGKR